MSAPRMSAALAITRSTEPPPRFPRTRWTRRRGDRCRQLSRAHRRGGGVTDRRRRSASSATIVPTNSSVPSLQLGTSTKSSSATSRRNRRSRRFPAPSGSDPRPTRASQQDGTQSQHAPLVICSSSSTTTLSSQGQNLPRRSAPHSTPRAAEHACVSCRSAFRDRGIERVPIPRRRRMTCPRFPAATSWAVASPFGTPTTTGREASTSATTIPPKSST